MIKRVVLAILFALTVVLVSAQKHESPQYEQSHGNRETPPEATPSTNITTTYNGKQQDETAPRWHKFVTFPEGLTFWALIVTLGAVTWQAFTTSSVAKATEKQAKIAAQVLTLQFRPIVSIRKINLSETDEGLSLEIIVVNKGGTDAHIRNGTVSLEWIYQRSRKSPIATATFTKTTIEPGQQQHLQINLSDSWIMYRFSVDPSYTSQMRMRCEGTIVYADRNGVERQTGFSRLRNAASEKWEIDLDPEYEYQD